MERRDPERPSRSLWTRMVGATLLRRPIYEDIAEDDFASLQSVQVLLMATISVALSALGLGNHPLAALAIVARVFILIYALRWIAAQRGPRSGVGSPASLQRTMGFAQTPLFFTFISAVPVVGVLLVVAGHLWSMAAMAVAARVYFGGRDELMALGLIALGGLVPLLIVLLAGPPPLPEAALTP